MSNYLKQEVEAARTAKERALRIPELAKKHNVTITSYVHDEVIVDGDPADIERFRNELMMPTEPIPTQIELKLKW